MTYTLVKTSIARDSFSKKVQKIGIYRRFVGRYVQTVLIIKPWYSGCTIFPQNYLTLKTKRKSTLFIVPTVDIMVYVYYLSAFNMFNTDVENELLAEWLHVTYFIPCFKWLEYFSHR